MIEVAPLLEAHFKAWKRLFEESHTPCFCNFWHFDGTKNDWLAQCAENPDKNASAHEGRLSRPEGGGLVAFDGADRSLAIGWMKLVPKRALPKLLAHPVYRATNDTPRIVYSMGCFLVHPSHRGRGVVRALAEAAPARVMALGGDEIEAYPRASREPMHPEEAWLGPESVFTRMGFTQVAGEGQYPVLRKFVR